MDDKKFYDPFDDFFANAVMASDDEVFDSVDCFMEFCDVEYEDVRMFHEKFSMMVHKHPTHLTTRKLHERVACMQEELDEFEDAIHNQDMAKLADALVDLVYFAKGTAVQMGLPWRQLWNEVQRANMDKERGIGKRGQKVDCIKPEGWEGPKIELVLAEAGYTGKPTSEKEYKDDAEHTNNI